MSSIDLKKMSPRRLALLGLGLSLAVVASSYLWWAPTRGGSPLVTYHGFPFSYLDTYYFPQEQQVNYPQPSNFIVDTLLFFLLFYGAFTLYRRKS